MNEEIIEEDQGPKYKFEMGTCDPRNNQFDHHGACSASNSFVMKMASVQLIEKLIMCDELEEFRLDDVEYNHLGHIDDIIMAAIPFAWRNSRIRNLYKFACTVSCVDSLGPLAKERLLVGRDFDTLTLVQEKYQEVVEDVRSKNNPDNLPYDEWFKIPLKMEQKWKACKRAADVLMSKISRDDLTSPVEIEEPEQCKIIKEENGIFLIEGYANPYLTSPYFLKQGASVVIFYREHTSFEGRYVYHIFAQSAYHADLSALWPQLQRKEIVPEKFKKESWGGNAGAGGSPRICGSQYKPRMIMHYVDFVLSH